MKTPNREYNEVTDITNFWVAAQTSAEKDELPPPSGSFLPLPTMGNPNAGHWCDTPPSNMAQDKKSKKKKRNKKRTRRVQLD